MVKIPTELYVCVPTRSRSETTLYTNIWANLIRKDTGEGIRGKPIRSFLDAKQISISTLYTGGNGYAGPFDINPKSAGSHETYVEFEGDTEFEPCKSEVITLKCDPDLQDLNNTMQVSPVSGNVPLTIKATGKVLTNLAYHPPPEYSIPVDLMVFDGTSTKRLQAVNTVMTNADGTYTINYTFTKPGTYAIFTNFLGDEKYISAWSNNGQSMVITVTGGGLPLSFEKNVTASKDVTVTISLKWILSDDEPTTPEGYQRASELDLNFGILGKYWGYIKTS